MKIYPLTIEHETFRQIPEDERVFVVQLGRLLNELMVFNRLSLALSQNEFTHEVEKRATTSVSLCVLRIFAGGLHEGWKMLQTSYFGPAISRIYDPLLDDSGTNALDELKRYFSTGDDYIGKVRNQFAFHSDPGEIRRAMNDLSASVDLTLYLARSQGNSLYWLADEVAARAMLTSIEGIEPQEALERLWSDVLRNFQHFFRFAGSAMFVFIRRNLGISWSDLEPSVIELSGLPDLREVRLPFFTAE